MNCAEGEEAYSKFSGFVLKLKMSICDNRCAKVKTRVSNKKRG